jgi:UDP-N-acetylmuramoyl-tripeptide--D-alanyl-D-alanine ligase
VIPLELSLVESLGRVHARPWVDTVTGVKIDSRRIEEGDLFVAVGTGSDFVRHAFARGAAAALLPDDDFAALAALGGAVRDRSSARVVAITGSTGKTSTKDILAAICSAQARTVAAERSFNNEIGVPLTLCRLEPDTEICIVELAMRGFGQIAELCAFTRPHIGVITNIGPVHLQQVGSLDGVARAKGELPVGMRDGATVVVPAGEDRLRPYLRPELRVTTFGTGGDVDLREGTVFAYGEPLGLELPFTAAHTRRNLLAAVGAAWGVGVRPEGSVEVRFSALRGERVALGTGAVVINDCYNANPLSMRAALDDLAAQDTEGRRVAVLGDMLELGPDEREHHREIGAYAAGAGVDLLVAVGPRAAAMVDPFGGEARAVADAREAAVVARELLAPGDLVLVKGSRGVGLEVVAEALQRETGG